MCRILIVDDHVANSAPLVRLFKRVQIDAQTATSGREALASLAVSLPDLVMLDVMMPEMDGFDVLRRIRAERRYDAVVVLMYTADVGLDSRTRAARLGAQGFIAKGTTSFGEMHAEVQRHCPVH